MGVDVLKCFEEAACAHTNNTSQRSMGCNGKEMKLHCSRHCNCHTSNDLHKPGTPSLDWLAPTHAHEVEYASSQTTFETGWNNYLYEMPICLAVSKPARDANTKRGSVYYKCTEYYQKPMTMIDLRLISELDDKNRTK